MARASMLPPYLVLLPVGFTEPGRSPGLLVSSYLTVSPLPRPPFGKAVEAVYFLWHCPYPKLERWALPTTAPCGVRTFLPSMTPVAVARNQAPGRSSDPPGLACSLRP